MLLIERHLLRQFAETVAAVAIVLLLVTLGALFMDLIGEIAKGKVPAGLLLSQLGLRSIRFLTLVMPLALFLGLLLAIGRLYAESEMAVLAGVGIGPQRLWKPLLYVSLPVLLVVGMASLWLAPASAHKAKAMIEVAQRSFLIAGLEPGRFVELPGKAGVLYVTELSTDGTRFRELFVQREHEGRMDIVTAHEGSLKLIGETQRYLHLRDGFRVEGAIGQRDFRLMRFEQNDVRVPDRERSDSTEDLSDHSTLALLSQSSPQARAELHWRLSMPLFVVALTLFALPLARSEPRQPQYGLVLFSLLVYLVGMLLLLLGTGLIGTGKIPGWLGLWWVHLPMLALATWLFLRDGRVPPAGARMKAFAPRLFSYLGRHVLLSTLATGAVLLGFMSVIDFVNELRDVGKESYTLSHAMLYVLLTMPTRCYEVFPTVAVIGSLLGLGGLAARSELTVMRAVGLSKLQMGMAAMVPLGVLTLLMVINIETAGPAGQQRAEELANAKNAHMIMARYSGLWAREGDLFLNARGNSGERHDDKGNTWVELEDVRLYQFDDKGRLQSLAHARKAEHSANGWILRDVERTHFLARSVKVDHIVSEHWKTEIDDATLSAQLARPRYLTSAELRTNIDYLKRNRLDAVKFESAYWSHWFYPYNVIVLCLATLPFAFGSLRSGGFGKRLFIGILIGIGALLLQRMCVDLADVYRFDVRLGYLFPPLLIWALCWGVLAKRI